MTEAEARIAILESYKAKYPNWSAVRVPNVIRASNGSFYCMVEATDEEDEEIEEICIVDSKGHVRIFDGTGDLVYNLANTRGALLSYFSPTVVGGFAFLITLIAVIGFTWAGNVNPQGMDVLKGVLALAAGFYFGNQTAK